MRYSKRVSLIKTAHPTCHLRQSTPT